jgi:hypothetical protein
MEAFRDLQIQLKLLVMTIAGIMVIIGFRRQGLKLFAGAIIMTLLFPFLLSTFQQIPLWAAIVLFFAAFVVMLRSIAGREAWGHFTGSVMYDVFWRFPLRLSGGFFRQIGRLFRRRT